jgi:hypothetical protein
MSDFEAFKVEPNLSSLLIGSSSCLLENPDNINAPKQDAWQMSDFDVNYMQCANSE